MWPFSRRAPVETRDISVADPATAALLLFGVSTEGATLSQAMTLSAVYRSASIISGSIASLPLRSWEEHDEDPATGHKTRARIPSVLDNPGGSVGPYTGPEDGFLTKFEWLELVVLQLLFRGNAYLQHIYDAANRLVRLHIVDADIVTPVWDETRPGKKRFDVRDETAPGGVRSFDLRTMTQIMAMSLDGLRGLSIIALAQLGLATGLSGDRAANKMFRNGALLSGIVTPEQDEELGPDEVNKIQSDIASRMTGVDNAGTIPVINRRLKFTPWTMTSADAQFLESRTFTIDEIGRWFGVPPHLLGLTEKSTSWGQGIESQNRGLARYTLSPWTSRIEQRLSLLLRKKTAWVEFDYKGFVKPSPEVEIQLILNQVNGGLITPNEGRILVNQPPIGGGDVLRLPAGQMPPDQTPLPVVEPPDAATDDEDEEGEPE